MTEPARSTWGLAGAWPQFGPRAQAAAGRPERADRREAAAATDARWQAEKGRGRPASSHRRRCGYGRAARQSRYLPARLFSALARWPRLEWSGRCPSPRGRSIRLPFRSFSGSSDAPWLRTALMQPVSCAPFRRFSTTSSTSSARYDGGHTLLHFDSCGVSMPSIFPIASINPVLDSL